MSPQVSPSGDVQAHVQIDTPPPQSLLQKMSSLSAVLTLVTIISVSVAAGGKLNSIETHSAENCRAINTGIVLTLEASRADARRRGRERDLDRIVDRFERLAASC